MSDDIVQKAKAVLKYAPDLPWEVRNDFDPMTGVTTYYLEDVERFRGLRNNLYFGTDVHLAEFVAAARSLVPELVAEVERLRNLVASLEVGMGNAGVLLAEAAKQYDRLLQERP